MYHYSCHILRIIDGDTVEADIDLGFYCWYKSPVRLYGIQAPEVRGETKEQGLKAKEYLSHLVEQGVIEIATQLRKDKDKYGRVLGILYVDGVPINSKMIEAGYAVPYLV